MKPALGPDYLPLSELPPREFETSRLFLRAVVPSDARVIFDLYANDPEATRYMSFKCTGRLEDTASYVEGCVRFFDRIPSPIKNFQWMMVLKESNAPIGGIGFGPKDPHTLSGGYILNKNWWGRGFATEGFRPLVEWGKQQPGVRRIEASHHPDNPASGKVLAKCGLPFEKLVPRGSIYPNLSDEPVDTVICAWVRPDSD